MPSQDMTPAQDQVAAVLHRHDLPMSPEEIAASLGKPCRYVRLVLVRMVARGKARKVPGDPPRYRLAGHAGAPPARLHDAASIEAAIKHLNHWLTRFKGSQNDSTAILVVVARMQLENALYTTGERRSAR